MITHILREGIGNGQFCQSSSGIDKFLTMEQLAELGKEPPYVIHENMCAECLSRMRRYILDGGHVKEEEKPNRYTILNNEQGKWQILKRNVTNTFWQVEAKDLGSRSNAITLMDALIKRDKEKS
jgi:hypothetical protein